MCFAVVAVFVAAAFIAVDFVAAAFVVVDFVAAALAVVALAVAALAVVALVVAASAVADSDLVLADLAVLVVLVSGSVLFNWFECRKFRQKNDFTKYCAPAYTVPQGHFFLLFIIMDKKSYINW